MKTEQLIEKLVYWIKARVDTTGCRGTMLGLSGGIDSAVLAVLCKRACPDNMLAVLLPCHSVIEDCEHAQLVSEKFSIPIRQVVLDGVYDTLIALLPQDETSPEKIRLAKSNIKARLRMTVLYYLANRLQYLVVGSSNRSELTIGYYTKYGDGGVDITPLGNLVKGQVRDLARFLGIPDEIVNKPPSAGLWSGQTDEAELGLSYDDIDRYLLTGQVNDDVRTRIEARIAAYSHKRQLPALPDF